MGRHSTMAELQYRCRWKIRWKFFILWYLADRLIDRSVSRSINITEHTSQWSYVCNAAWFSGHSGPGGGLGRVPAGVPVSQDPLMIQVLRQQMLLTHSMVDFLSRTAQGAGAVPPLPGAQELVPQAQVQRSQGQGSERLTMDTKWIPAAPLPDWKSWSTRSKELSGFKSWLDKFFFRPTPYGFRQVVQHVSNHVACKIN